MYLKTTKKKLYIDLYFSSFFFSSFFVFELKSLKKEIEFYLLV